MNDGLLHERENNEVSEQHLKENGQKFSRHCCIVLDMMYRGARLTARQLEREYNIDGRRLRDIYAGRKECKRAWRKDASGKNVEMEYWLEIPEPPTKKRVHDELQRWWNEYQAERPEGAFVQQKLF